MSQPNSIEPIINQTVSKVRWLGGHIVDLAAFGLILAALSPAFGLQIPVVKALG